MLTLSNLALVVSVLHSAFEGKPLPQLVVDFRRMWDSSLATNA